MSETRPPTGAGHDDRGVFLTASESWIATQIHRRRVMAKTESKITIDVEPDTAKLARRLREALAAELRAMADDLDPPSDNDHEAGGS